MVQIPEYANDVIKRLESMGFEAYLVGGAVRDMIMGKVPKDWDIATSALPYQTRELFEKTLDTGFKHGTVTVLQGGGRVEVTTYRQENEYSDGRRPDSVKFVTSLEEDLKRRDFTMNAIAFHPQKGYVDFFDGIADIRSRVVRCVGEPGERFREDALRLLRAVRFAAVLDFQIEEGTQYAVRAESNSISRISHERVRDELSRILLDRNVVRGFELLASTELLAKVLPELDRCRGFEQENPYHHYDVFYHTIYAVKAIKPELHLRLTMLLHDLGKILTKTRDAKGVGHFYHHAGVGKEIGKEILERLRFDNRTKNTILKLIAFHDYRIVATERSVKKAMNRIGRELFEDYLLVRKADDAAKSPARAEKLRKDIERVEAIYRQIMRDRIPVSLEELAVNGKDLIGAGIKEGKGIGEALNYLLSRVLENPQLNKKELLVAAAKEYAANAREHDR